MTALAGANQIYGAGMIESGVTLDFGQLVLDDEIARMIRHVLEGVQVRPETLLVRDILDVGWSGDFMSRDSTLLGMRTMSAPRLFDRGVYEAWDAAGRADPARRARDKALALLSEDDDDPLPADVAAELDAIVGRSDRVARVPRSETPPGTA
jgi:trimethylamine--corrinoid protein Co-methyltransferase